MLKFFMMIFEGFIFLANVFTRMFTWFSSMARFAMFSKALRPLKRFYRCMFTAELNNMRNLEILFGLL